MSHHKLVGLLFTLIICHGLTTSAQDAPRIKHVRAGAKGGIGKFTPGQWGLMKSEVLNIDDQPATALSLIYFGDTDDVGPQFGRQVWVPGNSRRTFWIPVKVPQDLAVPPQSTSLTSCNANTLLLDQSGASERSIRDSRSQVTDSRPFSVDFSKAITIHIGSENRGDKYKSKLVSNAISTLRTMCGHQPGFVSIDERRLPIVSATLASANQIVVTGNRMATDLPGRTALREWVQSGGRLWVMLDTMEEETCRRFLGDMCPVQYVDSVDLSEFRVVQPQSINTYEEQLHHEHPVRFVRTLVDNVDIKYSVNGWPSVFEMNYGQGQIVFSTIGAAAFSRPRTQSDRSTTYTGRIPRPEMNLIASMLFGEYDELPISDAEFAPMIEQSIGYKVASKAVIVVTLATFCLVLLFAGVFLAKSDRLGHLLWVAPLLALAATLPLIVVGMQSRYTVPPTIAMTQVIEAIPAGDSLSVRGLAGVHQTESNSEPIEVASTAVFVPDRAGAKGKAWRMVWSDLDRWRWENIALPAGTRMIPFQLTLHGQDPIRVQGTFDENGFDGRLGLGPITGLRDAIVASSNHVGLAIDISDIDATTAQLSGPLSNSLAPGQYSAKTMLNGEQARHVSVFRTMLDFGITEGVDASQDDRLRKRTAKYPAQPTLLAWSDPVATHFSFNPDARNTGDALLIAPIQLYRPEAGKTIKIPSVFLPYQAVAGNQPGVSPNFSKRLNIWHSVQRKSEPTIRFQLPACVLPFEVTRAKLRLKINAALRDVRLQSGSLDSLVTIGSENSPVGTFNYQITDAAALALDDSGGLHVSLSVSDIAKDPNTSNDEVFQDTSWKLDFIELEVEGQSLPPGSSQ